MGKRNALIMLGIAVVFALLAAFMAYGWLQKKSSADLANRPILVAVAEADLKIGSNLTADMIRMAPSLRSSLPSGYFADSVQPQGRTLLYPLKAGELILESKLAPSTLKGGGVAAIITLKSGPWPSR